MRNSPFRLVVKKDCYLLLKQGEEEAKRFASIAEALGYLRNHPELLGTRLRVFDEKGWPCRPIML